MLRQPATNISARDRQAVWNYFQERPLGGCCIFALSHDSRCKIPTVRLHTKILKQKGVGVSNGYYVLYVFSSVFPVCYFCCVLTLLVIFKWEVFGVSDERKKEQFIICDILLCV